MPNPPKDMTGKSTKFREINEIMNIPSMKAALTSFIDEAVKCKAAIRVQQDNLKRLREDCMDEVGLKPMIFNQYVAMVDNNDYLQRKDKLEEMLDLVETVMRDSNMALLPPAED